MAITPESKTELLPMLFTTLKSEHSITSKLAVISCCKSSFTKRVSLKTSGLTRSKSFLIPFSLDLQVLCRYHIDDSLQVSLILDKFCIVVPKRWYRSSVMLFQHWSSLLFHCCPPKYYYVWLTREFKFFKSSQLSVFFLLFRKLNCCRKKGRRNKEKSKGELKGNISE